MGGGEERRWTLLRLELLWSDIFLLRLPNINGSALNVLATLEKTYTMQPAS